MKGIFNAVIATPSDVFSDANINVAAYQFYVDCTNMLLGDTLKIEIKTDTTNAIRQTITDYVTIADLTDDKVALSFPLLMDSNDTYTVTLTQTTGTGRSFPWSVNVVEHT